MARLVRVQLNLREIVVDQEELVRYGHVAEDVAQIVGREYFETQIEVRLDLQEGSLRVLAVALGLLLPPYYFIGNYKAFKEGLVDICKDANEFGNDFCDKFLAKAGIKKQQVAKQQVKVQTPVELKELIEFLEDLNRRRQRIPLEKLAPRIQRVLRDLSNEEREGLVRSLRFENLPPLDQWPKESPPVEPPRLGRKPEAKRLEDRRGRTSAKGRERLRYKSTVIVEPRRASDRGS